MGIVIGSIRQGRLGDRIGRWVLETARATEGEDGQASDVELIDLKDVDLPLYASEVLPAMPFSLSPRSTTAPCPGR
ncbi:NAD(P)H-dependent oxidoreductase [Corynebacterium sp. zg-331]|nr:NAD(P)H-dependent oxidoreductase [Corynebacterium sp. zg-331]MPV53282.1 hypothetical protein [Corynebacterium sp. zg331]